jgi:hypothetical protein
LLQKQLAPLATTAPLVMISVSRFLGGSKRLTQEQLWLVVEQAKKPLLLEYVPLVQSQKAVLDHTARSNNASKHSIPPPIAQLALRAQ